MAGVVWSRNGDMLAPFVTGSHAKTGQTMQVSTCVIKPAHAFVQGTCPVPLFDLVLSFHVAPGTPEYEEHVENGALKPAPDGRYYLYLVRRGLPLSLAKLLALAHISDREMEEDIEQEADRQGRGQLEHVLDSERPALQTQRQMRAVQRRDAETLQAIRSRAASGKKWPW